MSGATPIPKRMKQARKRAGFSQAGLGIAAGVDESSASPRINQYEKGKHAPDFMMLQRMAKVLKVPVPFFYCDDDQMAELILALGDVSNARRNEVLKSLKG